MTLRKLFFLLFLTLSACMVLEDLADAQRSGRSSGSRASGSSSRSVGSSSRSIGSSSRSSSRSTSRQPLELALLLQLALALLQPHDAHRQLAAQHVELPHEQLADQLQPLLEQP